MFLDLVEMRKRSNIIKISIILLSFILIIISIFTGIKLRQFLENSKFEKEQLIFGRNKISHKVNFEKPIDQNTISKIKEIYKSEEKRAFLTFDDGPSKTVTPVLLDFLKEKNIKGNFFVLGSRVELYPDIVKRAYEEGHYIANHGYSHVYTSIYSSPQAVVDEYIITETQIKNAVNNSEYNSNIFRFPGGSVGGKYRDIKNEAIQMLEQMNVGYVDWNALTGDSAGKLTKEEMIDHLVQTTTNKNSIVILMHDAGDKILTYEVLPDIILYLEEQGYSFKSFYDIID